MDRADGGQDRGRMRNAREVWVLGALAAAAAVSVAACEPDDGLGSSVVSMTTDQLATHALEHDGVKVQWLSCSARSRTGSASVDCVGRTDDQRKISVKGEVTKQMDDLCVRGH